MIAQGGEKFLTIGNFKDDTNTANTLNNYGLNLYSYYYIDDVSVILCDSVTSINELENKNHLLTSPNPTTSSCTITAHSFIQSTLSLYDLTGRALLRQPFNEQATVDVSALRAGMYVVEVRDKEGRSVKGKVVRE